MERLRAATRVEHERCEAELDLFSRTSSIRQYADLLLTFLGFQQLVTPMISEVLALAPIALQDGVLQRQARCVADLRTLGQTPSTTVAASPRYPVASLDQQLGAWYVLEGSALGGTVIARHIRSALPEACNALSFFAGEGAGTAARWRQFHAFADQLETGGHVHFAGVHRGADLTFAAFLSIAGDA